MYVMKIPPGTEVTWRTVKSMHWIEPGQIKTLCGRTVTRDEWSTFEKANMVSCGVCRRAYPYPTMGPAR